MSEQIKLKKTFTTELWVGIFFFFGLLTLAYQIFNLASLKLSNEGYYNIVAEFDNISGLKEGADVEIAGVAVGSVEAILLKDHLAEVTLSIIENVQISDEDIAAVRTKGIIGDRYVKIIPGGSDMILKGGESLFETQSVIDIEDVIGKFIHSLE